jgi:hypothetical protein
MKTQQFWYNMHIFMNGKYADAEINLIIDNMKASWD